jgi:hypothetical protein
MHYPEFLNKELCLFNRRMLFLNALRTLQIVNETVHSSVKLQNIISGHDMTLLFIQNVYKQQTNKQLCNKMVCAFCIALCFTNY